MNDFLNHLAGDNEAWCRKIRSYQFIVGREASQARRARRWGASALDAKLDTRLANPSCPTLSISDYLRTKVVRGNVLHLIVFVQAGR